MRSNHLKTLAILLVVLIVGLAALTYSKRLGDGFAGELLFPVLKSQINDITQVTIKKAGETATIRNVSGKWVLAERQDYPIDTGKLRQLLLTLGNAKKLEEKTSNPDMYERLGVEDSAADSQGAEIRIEGPDSENSMILGNLAQRSYRYARIAGEEKSWLIDQNPTIPSGVGGWLLKEVVDINASRIKAVEIVHNDGETIRIEKESSEASAFEVLDIPDGRELSYAGVANGIAGALSGLNLEDVAAASEAERDGGYATTVFTTFDGLEITVGSFVVEENSWVTVSAHGEDAASDEAAKIKERLNGWAFQLQNYKADQLRRRWDDILKAGE